MLLWLHVNSRQVFQGRRGWGSVSMYSKHKNGRNPAKRLYPGIFLLFPQETGDEGWSQVTGISNKYTHHLCYELKSRFNYKK